MYYPVASEPVFGYTNFLTWQIAVYIDNDPDVRAELAEAQADGHDLTDGLLNEIISTHLWVGEKGYGLQNDLAQAALSLVNWSEIAAHAADQKF